MKQSTYKESVEALCQTKLKMSLSEAVDVIDLIERIRVLSERDNLYTQRISGLARGTNKEDPTDCSFVQRAVGALCSDNVSSWNELKRVVKELNEKLSK